MLRYDKQSHGLVAFYDIRPGNGAGPFLQPGARTGPPSVGVMTIINLQKTESILT